MKHKDCTKCGVELVIGSTWTDSKKKYSDYRCIKCTTKYRKEWAESRGEKETKNRRHNHFKRTYKITYDQFEKLWIGQDYKCAICNCDVSEKFNVDHCHTTGIVRGILCWDCNIGLGKFKDSISSLEKAIHYLKRVKHDN